MSVAGSSDEEERELIVHDEDAPAGAAASVAGEESPAVRRFHSSGSKKQTLKPKKKKKKKRCKYLDEDAEMSGDEREHQGDDDGDDDDDDDAGSLKDFINDEPSEPSSASSSSASDEEGDRRKRSSSSSAGSTKHNKKKKKDKKKVRRTKKVRSSGGGSTSSGIKKKKKKKNRDQRVGEDDDEDDGEEKRFEEEEEESEGAAAAAADRCMDADTNDDAEQGPFGIDAEGLERAEWRRVGEIGRQKRRGAAVVVDDHHGGTTMTTDAEENRDEEENREQEAEKRRIEEEKMVQSILKMQLYNDPDNCNNLSRNIRVVPHINDVQVHPDYDGYVYCFTSPAEGPTLSRMAWLQIMALLHVVNSPISGTCVIETDHLKPVFGTHGFMEKLSKRIPLNEEECSTDRQTRREINAQPICDMPFDVPFVAAAAAASGVISDDDDDDNAEHYQRQQEPTAASSGRCVWQVTNVADILVGMACVDYVVPSSSSSSSNHGNRQQQQQQQRKKRNGGGGGDPGEEEQEQGDGDDDDDGFEQEDENEYDQSGEGEDEEEHEDEDERTAAFWVVMLKTRKCYSFVDHLHAFVTQGEKEAAMRGGAASNLLGKRPNKEYDDVLAMIREVIMYQHEMSPNATAYFRRPGMTNAVDPLQAIMDKCMPPSLEHTCSIYEAFRSMTWHVKNEDQRRVIINVTPFSEKMPATCNMLSRSLRAKMEWYRAFDAGRLAIAKLREDMARVHKIKDPEEREAAHAEIMRLRDGAETSVYLPAPVLYPIDARHLPHAVRERMMTTGTASSRHPHRRHHASDSVFYDDYGMMGGGGQENDDAFSSSAAAGVRFTGIPDFPVLMQVDIQRKFPPGHSIVAFQTSFGGLPARTMQDIMDLMYRSSFGSARRVGGKRRRRAAHADEAGDGADDDDEGQQQQMLLPKDIMLSEPRLVQNYTRYKMFKADECTMEGFKKAGCDAHLLDRIMNVVRSTDALPDKIDVFEGYIERVIRQHKSSVLNNDLRSNNALYAIKYIESVKDCVCKDLRALLSRMLPTLHSVMARDDRTGEYRVRDEVFAVNATQHAAYWQLACPNTFLTYSWAMEDLHRIHNEKFFYLTPQNMKILNDVWTSMVQFRLGQTDAWTYMGMTTVICDASAKLRMKPPNAFGGGGGNSWSLLDGLVNTEKRPTSGLDFVRHVCNTRKESGRKYQQKKRQESSTEDAQSIVPIRRVTEASVFTGYVMFVDGEIVKMPETELATDYMLPEGFPDSFPIINAAVNSVPRDDDYESEMWTTVDPNKTNIRSKGVYRIVKGFGPFWLLIGKNFLYEKKTEERYRDMLIVCNIQPSNGPVDLDGMHRALSAAASSSAVATTTGSATASTVAAPSSSRRRARQGGGGLEDGVDRTMRKGVVRTNASSKSKAKGPKPTDEDQREWAPLHYFVNAVSGSVVAMMNKMGFYKLRINYGVKDVSLYMYNHIIATLRCFFDSADEVNASRYYESYQCRMVAETVQRATFVSMVTCDNVDAACVHAIGSLTYNAVHMSLLPVLHERLIQRLVQYEPLLGMATLGLCMRVPVVSIQSAMQLLDGRPVADKKDRLAMRDFVERCIRDNQCVQYLGMDAYGNPDGRLTGYATCKDLRESWTMLQQPSSNSSNGGGGGGHQQQQQSSSAGGGPSVSPHGVFMDPIYSIIRKTYKYNEKVLTSSAFVKDAFGFQRCVTSLCKPYDMRAFFGGMSAYHDMERMAKVLGVRTPFSFASDFVDGKDGQADPVMIAARIPKVARDRPDIPLPSSAIADADYCVALRIPDALLLMSLMQRPRRDVGIMTDFANSLAEYCIHLLPRSIFPFPVVPMTRQNPVHEPSPQVLMETQFNEKRHGGRIFRPCVLPRPLNPGIVTPNFKLLCEGRVGTKVLEDEHYMSEIIMAAEDMGIVPWHNFPVHRSSTLNIMWEYDVCYPMYPYATVDDACQVDVAASSEDQQQREEFLRRLVRAETAVMYMDPERSSMSLYALVDGERSELVHEFSLLPHLLVPTSPSGDSNSNGGMWGGVTPKCTSVTDMQNRLFRLTGYGPLPLYRRAGVLVNMSPGEEDDDDPGSRRLGCIVAHCPCKNGCIHDARRLLEVEENARSIAERLRVDDDDDDNQQGDTTAATAAASVTIPEDMRCYMCIENPFYEVLFENPEDDRPLLDMDSSDLLDNNDANNDENEMCSRSTWSTVRVTPARAVFRTVPVGTRLLLPISCLRRIIPTFDLGKQEHLAAKVKTEYIEQHCDPFFGGGGSGGGGASRTGKSKARRSGGLGGGGSSSSSRSRRKSTRSIMVSLAAQQSDMMQHRQHEPHQQQQQPAMLDTLMQNTERGKEALRSAMNSCSLQCFLSVPSILVASEGVVCVTISCARVESRSELPEVRNIFVVPQNLRMPKDSHEWGDAVSFVYA